MNNFSFASIKQLKDAFSRNELSHAEYLAHCHKRAERHNPSLGAALEIFDETSIIERSARTGALHGIPGLLKDNIAQQDRKLTCASKILEPYVAPYDATATRLLKESGAFLMGRANMDEFAMGSSTETSAFLKTCNPWDLSRVPGGSSGGSIAAVAAGLVPWALGSETGGSVRQPAALCGIVGSKPTYGRVSRYGLVAYASSLDQIGVATRTVADNAWVLSVIAGHDERDATSAPQPVTDYVKHLDGTLPEGFTIGVVENAVYAQGMDPEVVAAIEEGMKVLESLGARLVKIKLPTLDYTAAAYFILSRGEAASNLARFDGVRYGFRASDANTLEKMYANTRHDGFGEEVRRRIMVGNYVLSAGHAAQYYNNARKVQELIRQEFIEAFKSVDTLLMPVHPAPAFKFGAFDNDKLQMDLQDYFTCSANLAGIPAISVPCGFSKNKLPIGFQFLAPHFAEDVMFKVAHAYEQKTAWHTMHPEQFID